MAAPASIRIVQPAERAAALGLAVSFLMGKKAFAGLRFGPWSRVLTGQINRRQFQFAIEGANKVVGFVGWTLVARDAAEAWVEGRAAGDTPADPNGDCVIFNAWAADSTAAHRALLQAARQAVQGHRTIYFRRFYADGRVRPTRLAVTDFIARHIERAAKQG